MNDNAIEIVDKKFSEKDLTLCVQENRSHALKFSGCKFLDLNMTEIELNSASFSNCIFQNSKFNHCSFDDTTWQKCKAAHLDLSYSSCIDAKIEACDLSSSKWIGTRLAHTSFKNCKLIGASFLHSRNIGVLFEHCILQLANLKGISFKNQHVMGNDFSESDLSGCDFRDVVFDECRLNRAIIRSAKFDGADLRGCDLGDIQLKDATTLKGAVISKTQASELLRAYGLVVL